MLRKSALAIDIAWGTIFIRDVVKRDALQKKALVMSGNCVVHRALGFAVFWVSLLNCTFVLGKI